MKKMYKLNRMMSLALGIILLVFACKNEDPLDLSLKIKATEIKGTTAKISWELFSNQVLTHDVTVKETETGDVVFEESTGIDLTTEEVELEIEVSGLSPETNYTVTVVANTVGETFNKVKVKEDDAEFTTTELQDDEIQSGGADGEGFTTEELAGKWKASTQYYVLNADNTGEYGNCSEIAGIEDEKEYDITWENATITIDEFDLNTGEISEKQVNGIKVTDPEGFFIELECKVVDSVKVLYDNDNQTTFKKAEDSEDGEDEEDESGDVSTIEGISIEPGLTGGYNLTWTMVDAATGGYKVMVNGVNQSELPISGTPFKLTTDPVNGDTIKVQGFSDNTLETLVAEGTLAVALEDDATNEDAKFDDFTSILEAKVEAEDFIRGGEGVGYHDKDDNNEGGSPYRVGGVDIGDDNNGNITIGWTAEGEWLKYNINAPKSGDFHILINTASAASEGSKINIKIDDDLVIENMQLHTTGDWATFTEATSATLNLTEGDHVMTIEIASEGSNLDYFQFVDGPAPENDETEDNLEFSIAPSTWEFVDANDIKSKIEITTDNMIVTDGVGLNSEQKTTFTYTFDDSNNTGKIFESGNEVSEFTVDLEAKTLTLFKDAYELVSGGFSDSTSDDGGTTDEEATWTKDQFSNKNFFSGNKYVKLFADGTAEVFFDDGGNAMSCESWDVVKRDDLGWSVTATKSIFTFAYKIETVNKIVHTNALGEKTVYESSKKK